MVARTASNLEIRHYAPDTVITGLLDSDTYINRVGGSCIYRCPNCGQRIRFRWRNFYKADVRSFLKPAYRQAFNAIQHETNADEQGFLDFHCKTCQAPTRIIFDIYDYTEIAFHYDICHVYVGEEDNQS